MLLYGGRNGSYLRKSTKYSNTDVEKLKRELFRCDIPDLIDNIDVNALTDIMDKCGGVSAHKRKPAAVPVDSSLDRWERLVCD